MPAYMACAEAMPGAQSSLQNIHISGPADSNYSAQQTGSLPSSSMAAAASPTWHVCGVFHPDGALDAPKVQSPAAIATAPALLLAQEGLGEDCVTSHWVLVGCGTHILGCCMCRLNVRGDPAGVGRSRLRSCILQASSCQQNCREVVACRPWPDHSKSTALLTHHLPSTSVIACLHKGNRCRA